MWDLEIRLAHAGSASLARPANPDQHPIPMDVLPMSAYFAKESEIPLEKIVEIS